MPAGPKGQKRPADVIGNAVRVMRIATGEEADDVQDHGAKAAKILGAKGGKKRVANMTPERRAEVAREAAKARWRKTSDA
ncbi:RNA-binding protein [Mesorhizobium sp. LjNodule214]|uniref:RNA-binding protein n=1 Tax=Mesorhizobium sp. LjNodule214 TaxID=3342252 RepID=UPI003ED13ACD